LGGGVFNSGTLTIYESYITTNEAQGDSSSYGGHGGGIANTESLTLINSIINFNQALVGGSIASAYGAGIYSSGDVWIRGSTIQNNSGDKYLFGGGIYTINGNMQLYEVTIKDNSKVAYGGGIYVELGMVHINNSVINGNSSVIGGGVYAFGGDLNLSNVTISGNTAYDDGGGIYVLEDGMVNLANVTITDNSADFDQNDTGTGGGVYVYSSGGPGITTSPVNMRNSIIAWNMDPTGMIVRAQDCYGLIGSDGYNLIGWLGIPINNRPCTVIGDKTGNIIGQPVQLGPLADNDGPTQTHALLSNSPAINAGNPAGCRDYDNILLTSDQRRGLRVDRCDIGAFELGALTKHMNLPLVVK
jgi:parallel beta-helix repeat protein